MKTLEKFPCNSTGPEDVAVGHLGDHSCPFKPHIPEASYLPEAGECWAIAKGFGLPRRALTPHYLQLILAHTLPSS